MWRSVEVGAKLRRVDACSGPPALIIGEGVHSRRFTSKERCAIVRFG
jgi:hypothetical protein